MRIPPSLLVALTLSLGGCGGAAAEGSTLADTSGQSCAAGSYAGSGLDEGGVQWTFTLALREAGPDLVGAYHWIGSDGSEGDEQIRGRVDCTTGAFDWSGESASGGSETMDIITAHYTGNFVDRFRRFSGSWTGGTPGTLSGERR